MNEPGFITYVADRGIRTAADAAAYLTEKILSSYAKFGFGFYRVELKGSATPIGICGLAKRETLEDADVGFSILARFGGCGYAFEAAAATMKYGRDRLGLKQIIGITSPQNMISIHLLEKLGLGFQRKVHLPGYGPETLVFG